jgi:uncharacterized membrane protein
VSSDRSGTKLQRLYIIIAALAVGGVLISSISLYHHLGTSKGSFCDLSETFNCDLVNRSQYSTFHGVPVALIGIAGYLLILALATLYRQKTETPIMLVAASICGTGFALYLTYLEGYVIHAWCILCLSSLAVISSLCATSLLLVKAGRGA